MHTVIFSITIFELLLLFFQVIYYLERPNDAQQLRYLILLVLIIAYNVCSGGIMPDPSIAISMTIQNIVAYALGFAVSMYAIYFYYKLFDLLHLKFLATYGLFLFLLMSFLVGFVLTYLLTGNLSLSRTLAMIVPIGYGIWFVAKATRLLIIKIIKESKQKDEISDTLYLPITAYFSMMCWLSVPIINVVGDYQVLEHSVTNTGFILMSIFYIRYSTEQSKEEKLKVTEAGSTEMAKEKSLPLDLLSDSQKEVFMQLAQAYMKALSTPVGRAPETPPVTAHNENSFKQYHLSPREIQLLPMLIKGHPYKEIADAFHISEKTVSKHISNIFSKTGVSNKVELINKLLSPRPAEPENKAS